MIRLRYFLTAIFLTFCLFGCSQKRTLLSEEIKSINPYSVGQELIFVSSSGTESALKITEVKDKQFPDALGAFLNERKLVRAFRQSRTARDGTEERILTVYAETDKDEEKIDFNLSLKETSLIMNFVSFSEYQSKAELNLSTDFNSYDDVIFYENRPSRRIYEKEIVEFYWSKSVGYVRLIQKDGIVWDLKSIETK